MPPEHHPDDDVIAELIIDHREVDEMLTKLQGDALTKALKDGGDSSGSIVMINGAPTDNNAKLFKQGAHSVLDSSGYKVAKEYDTPDWSPDKAQTQMEQAITALGKSGFVGVYAANDGTAGGAIAAMKGAGIDVSKIPTTGQDAELAAIQRILAGEQYMTVYKAIKPEAEAAAQMAVDLLQGKKYAGATRKTQNGSLAVPSQLLTPVDGHVGDRADRAFGAVTAAAMRAVAQDVTEAIIPNAGHWLMEENPGAVVELVCGFVFAESRLL